MSDNVERRFETDIYIHIYIQRVWLILGFLKVSRSIYSSASRDKFSASRKLGLCRDSVCMCH